VDEAFEDRFGSLHERWDFRHHAPDRVQEEYEGGQSLLAINHRHVFVVLPSFVGIEDLRIRSQRVQDDRARVMILLLGEQFHILDELLQLLFFPGVAPLVVGDAEEALGEELLDGEKVIHR